VTTSGPPRAVPALAPAKCAIPRRSTKFVRRPRLISFLDVADPSCVVLVSAAAGYGKTLMLADWAAHRPHAVAWLNLEGDDNVDRRFWAGVLAAIDAATGMCGALSGLTLPAVPSRDPPFLEAVTGAISAIRHLTLVLDDVHVLTAHDPLHGLAALVRDRPPGLQLVLAARSDPALRLERLRLTGGLTELRAPALALSLDETAALLATEGIALRPDQLANLVGQTRGWAAGLRLVAHELAVAPDPDDVLHDLVGNVPALADYLGSEVVSRLPKHVVDVLTAVSVCDRVSAPLAAVLAGRVDAGEVLADLERATSLVSGDGTGRQGFRVHPLLRAQLHADLQRRRPDRLALLHGWAARHQAAVGETVAALNHAGPAGDHSLVARLLHVHGAELATSGRHAAVLAALETLPPVTRSGDVRLMLVAALAHLEVGHRAASTRFREQADAEWPDEASSDLESLRTVVRLRQGLPGPRRDVAGAGARADATAVELLLRVDDAAAAAQPRRAETLARAAIAEAQRSGQSYLEARATVALAVLVGRTGDVSGSLALAERANAVAPAQDWHGTVGEVQADLVQAYGALLQARPDECLRRTSGAGPVTGSGPDRAVPRQGILRAAAMFDLGEHRAGLDAMTQLRLDLADDEQDRPTVGVVAALEHGAAAALGLRAHARSVVRWAADRLGPTGDVLVMEAWGPATIGRADAARDRLRPVLDGSASCVVHWMSIEAQLLDSRIALQAGSIVRARRAVERAVALAGRTGAVRPLVTAPAGVGLLLTEGLGRFGTGDDLVCEILALRAARVGVPPSTPLTERERDVLELLPTLLSLDEIGDALAISINTVRSHVRNLHGKLGVASRADAIVAARRDGLIPSGVSLVVP
jgi:LuxR family transcriptional regulator, maltose regulon positive regulatory protein